MRNLIAATAVLVVVFWSAGGVADEAGDIDAIEQELFAEDRAAEIVQRAQERAERAVKASSIGQKVEQIQAKLNIASDALEDSTAYREYLGSEKFDLALDEHCPRSTRTGGLRRMLTPNLQRRYRFHRCR